MENPYFQYFCGEEFFQHALVFDRSSLTRWRQRMGEDKLKTLLQESLAVATRTDAMKPSDLARVVIDTTAQPKAVMFPTDAKLLNRARERWPEPAPILCAGRPVGSDQAPALPRRVLEQERRQRGRKVYSLHAPEVECIGKGKTHRPYEFGVKVSIVTTVKHSAGGQFVTHAAALPYDGHTLGTVIP